MKETQENLNAPEPEKRFSFEEAKKRDMVNSMYFNPEVNVPYVLTFKDAYNTERDMPVWEKGVKTEETERKVVLVLKIETINNEKVSSDQEWSVTNPRWREKFEPYGVQDQLTKMKFQVKVKLNGNKKELDLAAIGPK